MEFLGWIERMHKRSILPEWRWWNIAKSCCLNSQSNCVASLPQCNQGWVRYMMTIKECSKSGWKWSRIRFQKLLSFGLMELTHRIWRNLSKSCFLQTSLWSRRHMHFRRKDWKKKQRQNKRGSNLPLQKGSDFGTWFPDGGSKWSSFQSHSKSSCKCLIRNLPNLSEPMPSHSDSDQTPALSHLEFLPFLDCCLKFRLWEADLFGIRRQSLFEGMMFQNCNSTMKNPFRSQNLD